jgi:hypothetical protein
MRIWKMVKNEAVCESIIIDGDESTRFFDSISGKKLESWGNVYVKTLKENKECDMYEFSNGYPIVSQRTVGVLKEYLEGRVQILPVIYNRNNNLFVLNVTNIIDCLNHEKSEIRRLRSGKVGSIDSYSFNLPSDPIIFKIPETPFSAVFVDDKFKSVVEEAGLIGFKFIEVWESDEDVVKEREEKYEQVLAHINHLPGPEYSYGEVQKLIGNGKAAVNDKWKLQMSKAKGLIIGLLQEDGSYTWVDPIYIPPILLSLKWKLTDQTDR